LWQESYFLKVARYHYRYFFVTTRYFFRYFFDIHVKRSN